MNLGPSKLLKVYLVVGWLLPLRTNAGNYLAFHIVCVCMRAKEISIATGRMHRRQLGRVLANIAAAAARFCISSPWRVRSSARWPRQQLTGKGGPSWQRQGIVRRVCARQTRAAFDAAASFLAGSVPS